MERCAACRYWAVSSAWPDHMIDRPVGWRFCRRAEADHAAGDNTPQAGALAVAVAIDETGSGLLTAPGFGCVQWEAKGDA